MITWLATPVFLFLGLWYWSFAALNYQAIPRAGIVFYVVSGLICMIPVLIVILDSL